MSPRETTNAVRTALKIGYQGFDSAQWYENEHQTGTAISSHLSSHPDTPIFYTTKLRHNAPSLSTSLASITRSLQSSTLSSISLLLLHSPLGGRAARLTTWSAVTSAIKSGQVLSAGVSNYGVKHIEELMVTNPEIKPVVNQIEVHPFNTQVAIRECCAKYGILIQAYAPLARGLRFKHPVIVDLSDKYGCTPAQLMIRWGLQHGFCVLPKSVHEKRMVENADVGWFEISDEDMVRMDGLDEKLVTDWDPTDAE
ncbi:hypothetical protein OQA88_4253 [Cercophora sp. LCS_1]